MLEDPGSVDEVVGLVRELDELESEKKRVVASIDDKIKSVKARLAQRVSNTSTPNRSPSARLLDELIHHPQGAHYHDLALAVYGEDGLQKSIGRMSTLLSYLKNQGKVVSLGYGRWCLPEFASQNVDVVTPDELRSR